MKKGRAGTMTHDYKRKWNILRGNENPASSIPVPPDVERNRFLSQDETSRLGTSIEADENKTAAKAIRLLLLTGARRNEITHAKWEHVDWEKGTLLVPIAKSGKPRVITLSISALALLASVKKLVANPYIFPSPITGRPSASIYFPWNRIRKRAGLADVRLHDLRHSFASYLVNAKKDLYVVQKLLGHAHARSTQRYAHLTTDTLAEATEVVARAVDGTTGPVE
jgi:integrase